ncbi:MAG: hypothetical protein AMXMBFR48_23510 [Ignavibacteriales bacterium]
MRKILIDLLLLALTAGAIWGVIQFQNRSDDKSSIYTPAPADTVYTKGRADTSISVRKYHHTLRKKKSSGAAEADTIVTESYTAVISLAEVSDTMIAGFEVLVQQREVYRVDTVRVTVVKNNECEYWVAGAIVAVLVLAAVSL